MIQQGQSCPPQVNQLKGIRRTCAHLLITLFSFFPNGSFPPYWDRIGREVSKKKAREVAEFTPLPLESQSAHANPARSPIEKGVDVTAQDEDESTPLHPEVVQALFEHGADMGTRDNDSYSLVEDASSTSGHVKVDVVAQDEDESTQLPWGEAESESGHVDLARHLLEHHGADADATQDNDRSIPLHAASESGHVDLAQFCVPHSTTMAAQMRTGWLRCMEHPKVVMSISCGSV